MNKRWWTCKIGSWSLLIGAYPFENFTDDNFTNVKTLLDIDKCFNSRYEIKVSQMKLIFTSKPLISHEMKMKWRIRTWNVNVIGNVT
jgi:hypothetical protein